jgi:hypothetical protein
VTNDPSSTDWTAVASVITAVLALVIAILPSIVRWWRRPMLEIRVGNEEPHLRTVRNGISMSGVRLRIEVHNRGKSDARRVRAQVVRWGSETNRPPPPWIQYDIDPMALRWLNAPPEAGGGAFHTDLAPRMGALAEVINYQPSNGKVFLIPPTDEPRFFWLEAKHSFVTYWVEVAAAAENADVTRLGFYFSTSPKQILHNVHPGDPPEGMLKGGFFNIMRGWGLPTAFDIDPPEQAEPPGQEALPEQEEEPEPPPTS